MSSSEPLAVTAEPTTDGRPAPGTGEADPAVPAVLQGDAYAPQSRVPGWLRHPVGRTLVVYLLLFTLVGAIAGVVWNQGVDLPTYVVSNDGQMAASTSDRGLAAVFATDGWFVVLGALFGLMAGLFAWRWFKDLGWPVVFVAIGGALLAALSCWGIGSLLGPHHFDQRLTAASPGQSLPIDFALRSKVALLVWPLFATVPVLLLSSLAPDPEHPRRPRRSKASVAAADGGEGGASEARQV